MRKNLNPEFASGRQVDSFFLTSMTKRRITPSPEISLFRLARKGIVFLCLGILLFLQLAAQPSKQEWERIRQASDADHQLMLERLGIQTLRHGPSGDPSAPNAANTDESKAKTYDHLPDPMRFDDGSRVTNAEQWPERREEILEIFSREVYGRIPDDIPGIKWTRDRERSTMIGKRNVSIREYSGAIDNSAYPLIDVTLKLQVVVPVELEEKVPVILELGWSFLKPGETDPWQEQILNKGWGYAVLLPNSFQADHGAGLREGIIGYCNQGRPRNPEEWGALRAWAWGAGRVLDFFAERSLLDENRVAIAGLSRYGKAALVTLAYDRRFAAGLIASSGAGGAKLLRRTFGEQVENLASSWEYHWFAPNFIRYAGPLTPEDLPVDAHHLIAACAPRPVFISVGSPEVEGHWVDARGMFLAAVEAEPVYELLGAKGMGVREMPPEQTSLRDGELAFRQHSGGHTIGPNGCYFLEWIEPRFSSASHRD